MCELFTKSKSKLSHGQKWPLGGALHKLREVVAGRVAVQPSCVPASPTAPIV